MNAALGAMAVQSADAAVGRAAQHAAGELAGVLGLVDHHHAVDQHRGAPARWIAVGVFVGGEVEKNVGLKQRHIGGQARLQQATVAQAQGLVGGFFNGNGDVVFEDGDGNFLDSIAIPDGFVVFVDNGDSTWSAGS
jgi:hypothetical protein